MPAISPEQTSVHTGTRDFKLVKIREDSWNSNPPRVTSHLSLFVEYIHPSRTATTYYDTPACGLGWTIRLKRIHHPKQTGDRFRLFILLLPGSSKPIEASQVLLSISFPGSRGGYGEPSKTLNDLAIHSGQEQLSVFNGPPSYRGQILFEITLTFHDDQAIPITTFPVSSSSLNPTKKALRHSLDEPSFIDVKFYLFSAKSQGQGRQVHPKAVYAKSAVLTESGEYLKNLLSSESGFSRGTPCGLRDNVLEEIAKLDAETYDYESDSDLEDEDEDEGLLDIVSKGKGTAVVTNESGSSSGTHESVFAKEASGIQDGRAYAINGTAHRTWRAFIFYAYTSDIEFNAFKSQRAVTKPGSSNSESISCSPKSMYRFADYADLPSLKSLAQEGIRKNLSKSNIIAELFSSFTHKYQEIIELEVDFLVNNLTDQVNRDFNAMLQMIVLGTKPHCFRVLAFAIRRMLGDSTEKAWGMLDDGVGHLHANSPEGLPEVLDQVVVAKAAEEAEESWGVEPDYA